jgi:hypothetical protein
MSLNQGRGGGSTARERSSPPSPTILQTPVGPPAASAPSILGPADLPPSYMYDLCPISHNNSYMYETGGSGGQRPVSAEVL